MRIFLKFYICFEIFWRILFFSQTEELNALICPLPYWIVFCCFSLPMVLLVAAFIYASVFFLTHTSSFRLLLSNLGLFFVVCVILVSLIKSQSFLTVLNMKISFVMTSVLLVCSYNRATHKW